MGDRLAAQTAAAQGLLAGVQKAFAGVRIPALPSQEQRDADGDEILARLREQPDIAEVFLEVVDLITMKDAQYGGAWRDQGYMGNVARVLSKAARLKNLMWCDEDPSETLEEPVMDTLIDMIALAAFTVVNLREGNRWGENA